MFFLLCLVFSSCVFATDVDNTIQEPKEILSDLYSSNENHVLNTLVTGNVFTTTKNFTVSETSSISGNIFVVANTVSLKSDVTYSDKTSRDGEYAIESINSKSTIKGNAYIVCKEFTMEPGCEISGDLYIVASSINIQKSASIGGNIFATSKDFTLNGRVQNSVYCGCESFNMNYYGSINNDLHLDATKANLSSVIHRNAFINATQLETTPTFILYGNLDVNASSVSFSGEVDGSANINTKDIKLVYDKEDSSSKCLIKGDLNYSAIQEISFINGIVKGKMNYSPYVENAKTKTSYRIKDFIIDLITFVLYVFVVVWLFTIFAKDYSNRERPISVKNILIALGIGLLSTLCVAFLTTVLLITTIGSRLAVVLFVSYILVLLLATPLFVLDIARSLRGKINFFVLTLIIALVLFLISQIPYAGIILLFLFKIIGVGRIIKYLISKKNVLHYKEQQKADF